MWAPAAGQCLSLQLTRNSKRAFVAAVFSLCFKTKGKHSSVNLFFSKWDFSINTTRHVGVFFFSFLPPLKIKHPVQLLPKWLKSQLWCQLKENKIKTKNISSYCLLAAKIDNSRLNFKTASVLKVSFLWSYFSDLGLLSPSRTGFRCLRCQSAWGLPPASLCASLRAFASPLSPCPRTVLLGPSVTL